MSELVPSGYAERRVFVPRVVGQILSPLSKQFTTPVPPIVATASRHFTATPGANP